MLQYIKNIKKRIYLELIFVTGLRSSEARALTWDNINFKDSMITVSTAIKCRKYGIWKITTPKTRTSMRTIRLDRITLLLLEKLKEEGNSKFVFNRGGIPRPSGYCKADMKRACIKAGVTILSIHELRHSHATNMLLRGVPISIISRRLGHSKTSITEDLYIHLIPANETLIIDKLQYRSRNALNV